MSTSFLPSRRLRTIFATGVTPVELASIGIACKATTMLARAIVVPSYRAMSGYRIGPHGLTARPILISRTPPFLQFLPGRGRR